MNLQKTASLFVIIISIVITLIYGQSIITPFILGLLLWFIDRTLKRTLDRIEFVRTKVPKLLKGILSSGIILITVILLIDILSTNITQLSKSVIAYQSNIDNIITQINELTGLNIRNSIKNFSGDFDFSTLIQSLLASLTDILSNTFMIILYALFVWLEESNFKPKLQAIFSGHKNYSQATGILDEIENSISSYFKLKTLVSLITGVLSYITLAIIGVDAPVFWAFLIFILNFIPTIGSLVGTLFPAAYSLLQFGEITPAILVLVIVGIIQVLVGNFLEPKLMGRSMNISPLVTIIALSVWGAIWGIIGMILSVPITVVTIIILSKFKKSRPIAIMLSEKGSIGNIQKD